MTGFRQGPSPGAVAAELSAAGMMPLKIELAEEETADKRQRQFLVLAPKK